jgi:hypothetical protein
MQGVEPTLNPWHSCSAETASQTHSLNIWGSAAQCDTTAAEGLHPYPGDKLQQQHRLPVHATLVVSQQSMRNTTPTQPFPQAPSAHTLRRGGGGGLNE